MTTSYRDATVQAERAKRGTGTIRERLPDVWEIRVVVGFDPVHTRSVQRSFTVHGDAEYAEGRRRELVGDYGVSRVAFTTEAARLTIAELMERFFEAPHLWKPATVVSHRPVVRALINDAIGRRRLVTLTPSDVRAAICRWQAAGLSVASVSSRWLVLRSAVSWAVGDGVLRSNPLAGMRGAARPEPRRHHTISEVRQLLRLAEENVESTAAALERDPESPGWRRPSLQCRARTASGAPGRRLGGKTGRAGRVAPWGPGRAGADNRARPVSGRTRIHEVFPDPPTRRPR